MIGRNTLNIPDYFICSQFQLQLQLYLFNLNLQFHDSFNPRIGQPNRGRGRGTNLRKGKGKKRNILQTVIKLI